MQEQRIPRRSLRISRQRVLNHGLALALAAVSRPAPLEAPDKPDKTFHNANEKPAPAFASATTTIADDPSKLTSLMKPIKDDNWHCFRNGLYDHIRHVFYLYGSPDFYELPLGRVACDYHDSDFNIEQYAIFREKCALEDSVKTLAQWCCRQSMHKQTQQTLLLTVPRYKVPPLFCC